MCHVQKCTHMINSTHLGKRDVYYRGVPPLGARSEKNWGLKKSPPPKKSVASFAWQPPVKLTGSRRSI